MSLQPGKYDSPTVLSHCVREAASGNMGVNVEFLVDPQDGGAPERIMADIWLVKGGDEINERSIQSLAYLGADVTQSLDALLLLLNNGEVTLDGSGVTIDCQLEAARPKLDQETNEPVINEETGEPVMWPEKVKVAWINRLGAGPVEAADDAAIGGFFGRFGDKFGAAVKSTKIKPARKHSPQKPQAAAQQAATATPASKAAQTPAPAQTPAATQPGASGEADPF